LCSFCAVGFSFKSPSSISTAFTLCVGARCAYLRVMVRVLCPKSPLTQILRLDVIIHTLCALGGLKQNTHSGHGIVFY